MVNSIRKISDVTVPDGIIGSRKRKVSSSPVYKLRRKSEANSPVGRLAKKNVPRKIRSGVSTVDEPFRRGGQYYTTVASYKEELVAVKMCTKKEINMDRSFLLQVRNVRRVNNILDNLLDKMQLILNESASVLFVPKLLL